MNAPLLRVDDLSVHAGSKTLLRNVSFALQAGECLTIVGESGAGKSLLAQAVMATLPPGLRADGSVMLGNVRSSAAAFEQRRPLWGRSLALLPQEPSLALDPLMTIATQLAEVHELVLGKPYQQTHHNAALALRAAGLGSALRKYPWQLSGGMAQRAAASMALAGGAKVLMVDEPTKGLDAFWRHRALAALQKIQSAGGCIVTITHDLRAARFMGGRVMVLRDGDVVEVGETARVLEQPQADFTRRLIDADPARWTRSRLATGGDTVLQAQSLAKGFGERLLFENLDLTLRRGQRLALQGASGAGKTTLGNVLLGLLRPDAGRVDRAPGLAASAMQKLYQDPALSFPPQLPLEVTLRDVARLHRCPWSTMADPLAELRIPTQLLKRRPAQVSSGELQRVALVRALATRPAVLFADEPTSRLDPISQQETMTVLLDAIHKSDAALILVTHDDDIADAVGTDTIRFGAGFSGPAALKKRLQRAPTGEM